MGSPRVRPSERRFGSALCTWERGKGSEEGATGLSHAPAATEDTKGGCKTRIALHPLSLASVVQSLLQSFGGQRAP